MAIKQLSVFVENKSGKLLETVKALADAKIDIRAMSIADTKDFGILRLIVSDIDGAKNVLEDSIYTVTDVVAAEMKDESGALYHIMSVLGNADINIDYMYAFTSTVNSGAYVVLRVDDNNATEKVLEENGIKVLASADI
ncbi:MAG: hypothetical protein J1F17_03215 [Oscillospiraceae bacterium]|nr:hypothetical protein [Oscillospiraceae bacterium]